MHRRRCAERDGETTDTAIFSLREEIVKMHGARQSVMRSVPPLDVLYAAAGARVKELAERGRPTIAVDRGQLVVRFSTENTFGTGTAKDATAFMVWMNPEAVVEKLHRQIDAMRASDLRLGTPVMPTDERDRRVAELDAKILEAERAEEHLITIGEDFGLTVPRREDASPLAILCLSMERRQARAVA
jgi:hypothetical protein